MQRVEIRVCFRVRAKKIEEEFRVLLSLLPLANPTRAAEGLQH